MYEQLLLIKNLISGKALDKKIRYFVTSLLLTALLWFAGNDITSQSTYIVLYAVYMLVMVGIILVSLRAPQRFLVRLMFVIIPIHVVLGYLSSYFFFPNLGVLVKFIALAGVLGILYISLLVNNIFLVVQEKGSLIPLYSAANAWLQILSIIVLIPFLSGAFKTSTDFLIQNLVVFIACLSFNFFIIWVIGFDTDIKVFQPGERRWLSFILAAKTFLLAVAVSFIPTESFLRALFIATLVLFDFGYIQAHFKNKLNLRLVLQNGLIIVVFFILLFLFKP